MVDAVHTNSALTSNISQHEQIFPMITSTSKATITDSLARKLVLIRHPKQKISNEAIQLTAELLRVFILEARNRASVEVSFVRLLVVALLICCYITRSTSFGTLYSLIEMDSPKLSLLQAECETEAKLEEDDSSEGVRIKAHHITKIAAELLLDL